MTTTRTRVIRQNSDKIWDKLLKEIYSNGSFAVGSEFNGVCTTYRQIVERSRAASDFYLYVSKKKRFVGMYTKNVL